MGTARRWFKLAETTKSSIEAIPAKYHVNLEECWSAILHPVLQNCVEPVISGELRSIYIQTGCSMCRHARDVAVIQVESCVICRLGEKKVIVHRLLNERILK